MNVILDRTALIMGLYRENENTWIDNTKMITLSTEWFIDKIRKNLKNKNEITETLSLEYYFIKEYLKDPNIDFLKNTSIIINNNNFPLGQIYNILSLLKENYENYTDKAEITSFEEEQPLFIKFKDFYLAIAPILNKITTIKSEIKKTDLGIKYTCIDCNLKICQIHKSMVDWANKLISHKDFIQKITDITGWK